MNIYNNFGFGNSAERIKNMERVIFVNMTKTKYALDIKDSIDRTKVYDSSALIYPERGSLQTEFVFEQTDSVSAVFKYADKNTAILNFANFTTPGGGFIYGAMAQEEALCLESTLYPVISDRKLESYYFANKRALSSVGCLYSNRTLYSPGIVFFRDEEGEEKRCDVITCAAPNASEYLAAGGSQKMNGNALLDRMTFILDIAVKNGVKTLILGAFGCGVFGQNPETLGALYNYLLTDKYKGAFERVVFAVIDEKTLRPLESGFCSR